MIYKFNYPQDSESLKLFLVGAIKFLEMNEQFSDGTIAIINHCDLICIQEPELYKMLEQVVNSSRKLNLSIMLFESDKWSQITAITMMMNLNSSQQIIYTHHKAIPIYVELENKFKNSNLSIELHANQKFADKTGSMIILKHLPYKGERIFVPHLNINSIQEYIKSLHEQNIVENTKEKIVMLFEGE